MIEVTGSGVRVEAVQHYRAELPKQVPGEHLWIVASVYRVNPAPNKQYHLDTENLISIDGPGCFWCEELWTPEIAARPCKG